MTVSDILDYIGSAIGGKDEVDSISPGDVAGVAATLAGLTLDNVISNDGNIGARTITAQNNEFVVQILDYAGNLAAYNSMGPFGWLMTSNNDGTNFTKIQFSNGDSILMARVVSSGIQAGIKADSSGTTLFGQIIGYDLGIKNYANDSAASAAGVPVGGLYHTSGTVKIRLT